MHNCAAEPCKTVEIGRFRANEGWHLNCRERKVGNAGRYKDKPIRRWVTGRGYSNTYRNRDPMFEITGGIPESVYTN